MSYEQFFREAQKSKQGVSAAPKVSGKGNQQKEQSPEDLLRAHFATAKKKAAAARGQVKRKRSGPPVFASILLLIALVSGLTGYLRPDLAQRIPTIEWGLFAEADAADAPKAANQTDPAAKSGVNKKSEIPVADVAKQEKAEKNSAGAAETSPSTAEVEKTPDVKQWTPEEISFFKKLGERKESLDRREAELAKLEEELQKQKKELDDRIRQLESMRKEISTTLKDRVVLDQEKVAKLVDVYSNMKPTQAARVIETLNEELAVTILDRLKKKNAAEILNAMSAPKAKRLSEMLTGYETAANAEATKK